MEKRGCPKLPAPMTAIFMPASPQRQEVEPESFAAELALGAGKAGGGYSRGA